MKRSDMEKLQIRRDLRDYANSIYNPGHEDIYRIRKCDII
jgi:hypothetical protein